MCVRCSPAARRHATRPANPDLFTTDRWIARTALLAGASLTSLVATGAQDRAFAACTAGGQTIASAAGGPVYTNGGAISITSAGALTGSMPLVATDCAATTITNAGSIVYSAIGVLTMNTIGNLINGGTITAVAAAPVIEKYSGVLEAADVFTAGTTFQVIESIRLDRGYAARVHP